MAETESFRNLAEEKQERIYRAAVQEFSACGYSNASMNNLVKEAGISKGSLFKYFGTKLDLFDSVVNMAVRLVKTHLKRVRSETNGLPVEERIRGLLLAGFSFIDEHPQLARIYFRLLQSVDSPFGVKWQTSLHRESVDFLHGFLAEGKGRGEIHPDINLQQAAFILSGIMQQLMQAYYTEHVDSGLGLYRSSQEELESWVNTTLQMFFHGIGDSDDNRTGGEKK